MKKLIILAAAILCFVLAGCNDYCAYCKGVNTDIKTVEDGFVMVSCKGCGRSYYMKKLPGDFELNIRN